jgi:hypothetical protein
LMVKAKGLSLAAFPSSLPPPWPPSIFHHSHWMLLNDAKRIKNPPPPPSLFPPNYSFPQGPDLYLFNTNRHTTMIPSHWNAPQPPTPNQQPNQQSPNSS